MKFIEISPTKVGLISIILVLIISGSIYLHRIFVEDSVNIGSSEEKKLRSLLAQSMSKYEKLYSDLHKLIAENNDLRLAVNLPVLSEDDRKVGIGGGSFNNNLDFLKFSSQSDISSAFNFISEVSRKIEFEKQNYSDIKKSFSYNRELYKCIPAIKPCTGTLSENGFGMRMHPVLGYMKMHYGLDIITDIGTPIFASGAGKVIYSGIRNGFGLVIEIDHGFGYKTIYGHLSAVNIQVGSQINRGTLIGYTGNSGLSSGPHLHYEVLHNGVNLNPSEFIFDDYNIFANTKDISKGEK
jgi:murein DD-endopeptidase MepM/ murein hydrolase activator NlpD